jgi:hypothetical protein
MLDGASWTFFLVPGCWGGGCMGQFLEPPCLVMLYLAAKPSHVWVDVDGLACSLHRATVCSHQKVGQCRLTLCIDFLSLGNGRPSRWAATPSLVHLLLWSCRLPHPLLVRRSATAATADHRAVVLSLKCYRSYRWAAPHVAIPSRCEPELGMLPCGCVMGHGSSPWIPSRRLVTGKSPPAMPASLIYAHTTSHAALSSALVPRWAGPTTPGRLPPWSRPHRS